MTKNSKSAILVGMLPKNCQEVTFDKIGLTLSDGGGPDVIPQDRVVKELVVMMTNHKEDWGRWNGKGIIAVKEEGDDQQVDVDTVGLKKCYKYGDMGHISKDCGNKFHVKGMRKGGRL